LRFLQRFRFCFEPLFFFFGFPFGFFGLGLFARRLFGFGFFFSLIRRFASFLLGF